MKTVCAVTLLLSLGLAACNTPASSDRRPSDAFASLRKDMTAGEVTGALGEPAAKRTFKSEPFASEVWVYHRKARGEERQVPIRIQEVPAINPITGLPFTRQEPVYETQVTTVDETVELLMVEHKLVAWKSRRDAGSSIEFR